MSGESEQVGTLCLTRRVNESITIDTSDGPVVVRVRDVVAGRVLLSVRAKRSVQIRRDEAGLPAK